MHKLVAFELKTATFKLHFGFLSLSLCMAGHGMCLWTVNLKQIFILRML